LREEVMPATETWEQLHAFESRNVIANTRKRRKKG